MRFYGYIILISFLLLISVKTIAQDGGNNLLQQALADTSLTNYIVADIRVFGYKKTKDYIIEREIPFKTGERIPRTELQEKLTLCRQQLMNTSLFVDVEVSVVKKEADLIFISVKVKERWYLFPLPYFKLIDRNLNQWWVEQRRSLERVNYGLKFKQDNVSGRNDQLNIWVIHGYTQQLSFRYQNPFLDKSLRHGMNIGIAYSRNREMNFNTDTAFRDGTIQYNRQKFIKTEDRFLTRNFHADLSYSYRPAIKTRHNFRISYTDKLVADTVIKRNPNYFNNGSNTARYLDLSYLIQHFNVDYIPYPLKGFMGDASFYKRGWGKQNNIWEVSARGDFVNKVLPKTYLHLQAAGNIRLPFDQPFYSSGLFGSSDFYLRGLEYYVINGVAGGFGRATIKNEIISFNYRNPISSKTHDKIPFRIFAKVYGDGGYAYDKNPGTSLLNNKMLYTYGAGIDVVTFYDLVLKFEYSFNQLGQSGFFFHTKSDF